MIIFNEISSCECMTLNTCHSEQWPLVVVYGMDCREWTHKWVLGDFACIIKVRSCGYAWSQFNLFNIFVSIIQKMLSRHTLILQSAHLGCECDWYTCHSPTLCVLYSFACSCKCERECVLVLGGEQKGPRNLFALWGITITLYCCAHRNLTPLMWPLNHRADAAKWCIYAMKNNYSFLYQHTESVARFRCRACLSETSSPCCFTIIFTVFSITF